MSKAKKRLAVLVAVMVFVASALTVSARNPNKEGYLNAGGYSVHCSILVLGANLSSVAQASTNSGGLNNPTPITLPSGSSVSTSVSLYNGYGGPLVGSASGGTSTGTWPSAATPNGYYASSTHSVTFSGGVPYVRYLYLP